jgi:tetratricopeptide (TPR) repeat protein
MNVAIGVSALVIIGWLLSVCLHEFAHALVAYLGGDKEVKERGYLHFNPFAYIDFRISILLPTVFLLLGGIGLPGAAVLINSSRLRNRWWGSFVSAAGPLATLLFIIALAAIIRCWSGLPFAVQAAAAWLLNIEIIVFVLNILPIPGLDGFGIIEPFLPKPVMTKVGPFSNYGLIALYGLLWFCPGANRALWSLGYTLLAALGVDVRLAYYGYDWFHSGAQPLAIACLVIAAVAYFARNKFDLLASVDWFHRGLKLLKDKEYERCIELMTMVLAVKKSARAWRLMSLAQLWLALQEKDDAKAAEYRAQCIKSINNCVAVHGDAPGAFENWYYKGVVHQNLKEPHEAISAYKRSLALNPVCVEAYRELGRLLLLSGNIEESSALCEKPAPGQPTYGEAMFIKGVILIKAAKFQEAVACFDDAIRLGVQLPLSTYNRSLALGHLGDVVQAREVVTRSREEFGHTTSGQAQLFITMKHYEEALTFCNEHLLSTPDDGSLITVKASALFYLGRFEESLTEESKAIALGGQISLNYYNSACSYVRLNRVDEAFVALTKAFESHPTDLMELAQTDEDLEPIRKDARFKTLFEDAPRSRVAAE